MHARRESTFKLILSSLVKIKLSLEEVLIIVALQITSDLSPQSDDAHTSPPPPSNINILLDKNSKLFYWMSFLTLFLKAISNFVTKKVELLSLLNGNKFKNFGQSILNDVLLEFSIILI